MALSEARRNAAAAGIWQPTLRFVISPTPSAPSPAALYESRFSRFLPLCLDALRGRARATAGSGERAQWPARAVEEQCGRTKKCGNESPKSEAPRGEPVAIELLPHANHLRTHTKDKVSIIRHLVETNQRS